MGRGGDTGGRSLKGSRLVSVLVCYVHTCTSMCVKGCVGTRESGCGGQGLLRFLLLSTLFFIIWVLSALPTCTSMYHSSA